MSVSSIEAFLKGLNIGPSFKYPIYIDNKFLSNHDDPYLIVNSVRQWRNNSTLDVKFSQGCVNIFT